MTTRRGTRRDDNVVTQAYALIGYVMIGMLAVLLYFWMVTVTVILVWLILVCIGRSRAEAKKLPPAIHHPPKRVKAPPKPKPVQPPPPGYLRKWTFSRRMDVHREHDQWQELFDRHAA